MVCVKGTTTVFFEDMKTLCRQHIFWSGHEPVYLQNAGLYHYHYTHLPNTRELIMTVLRYSLKPPCIY